MKNDYSFLRQLNFSYSIFLIWISSIFIVSLGATIALLKFFIDRSLWLDEALLAFNIVGRDYVALSQTLDHSQVSPILFLFVEKLLLEIFSDPDYALRALPTLCFFMSLLLIYKTAKILTKNSRVAVAAICLLSVSPFFLSYATEVKPYMSDALVTLFLLYISLRVRGLKFGLPILCIAGVFSIYSSNTSVIILCTVGLFLLYQAKVSSIRIYPFVIVISIWVFSFAINYYLFMVPSLGDPYLKEYWGNAFVPFSHPDFWYFGTYALKTIARTVFGYPLHHWIWKLFALIYLGCFLSLIRARDFSSIYLLFFPLILHLLLSATKLYPFADRLLFYQIPLFIIVISYSFVYWTEKISGRLLSHFLSIAPALVFVPGHLLTFPIYDGGIRPAIEYLRQHVKKGDSIFIYPTAKSEYQYYEAVGLAPKSSRTLSFDTIESTISHFQSDCFDGKLWVIFSGINPNKGDEVAKRNYVVSQLKALKREINNITFPGSSIYFISFQNKKDENRIYCNS